MLNECNVPPWDISFLHCMHASPTRLACQDNRSSRRALRSHKCRDTSVACYMRAFKPLHTAYGLLTVSCVLIQMQILQKLLPMLIEKLATNQPRTKAKVKG